MSKFCFILLSLVLLSGCSGSIEGNRYQEMTPKFELQKFFDGHVKAWGVVQDRSGNVTQRFKVDIIGSKQNGQLVLDETFDYSLGNGPKKRVWKISARDGQLSGRADDILGTAQGKAYGNALYWTYQMNITVDGSEYKVTFDDWMWAFDKNTLMNRSYIKKFGIVFAEVTIFMQRQTQ